MSTILGTFCFVFATGCWQYCTQRETFSAHIRHVRQNSAVVVPVEQNFSEKGVHAVFVTVHYIILKSSFTKLACNLVSRADNLLYIFWKLLFCRGDTVLIVLYSVRNLQCSHETNASNVTCKLFPSKQTFVKRCVWGRLHSTLDQLRIQFYHMSG